MSGVTPSRAIVAKSRNNITLPERLTLTGFISGIFGPVAGENAAPDILNCPDRIPAFATQGSGVAY
ncbi:MAG: hypothetical protein J2P21_19120, partial [Chloracidobacterium sp.]|nr:hypothetical protein [Chloracidobacterium sp.]